MLNRFAFALIVTSLINSAVLLLSGAALAASSCEDIKNLKLDHAVITSAFMVPKGPASKVAGFGGGPQNEIQQTDLPAHCRVQIDLMPTIDSMIKMELWLPAENWNKKFMGVGNGFFAGSIQGMMFDMPDALRLGYATAGTDTGHQEQGDWIRLFLGPGMGHCGGGPGVNSIDSIGTLEKWVEKGVAPDQIIGYGKDGLARPLCPYPQYAEYKGTGELKDKDNWQCKEPAQDK